VSVLGNLLRVEAFDRLVPRATVLGVNPGIFRREMAHRAGESAVAWIISAARPNQLYEFCPCGP
jgi:hypothetical protein